MKKLLKLQNYFSAGFCIRLIFIVFIFYCCLFIYKTSFIINGQRHFALLDDAMISMKYADNLILGNGLTWNPHERIEGYTNLLWVLYMSLFHLMKIPYIKISLFIQASSAIFLFLNLICVYNISKYINNKNFVSFCSVFLTAFYFHLTKWSLIGMETGLLALIVSFSALLILKYRHKKYFDYYIYILMGTGTLIRLDMAVPYIISLLFIVFVFKKSPFKNFFYGFIILFIFLTVQTLWRYLYYGDILPNTYYLKMTGIPIIYRISRGFCVFYKFIFDANWIIFSIPFLYVLYNKNSNYLYLLFLCLAQSFYSIYVGGDFWEHLVWQGANRFLVVTAPMFFIVLSLSLDNIFKLLAIDEKRIIKLIFLFFTIINLNRSTLYEWLLLKDVPSSCENITNINYALKFNEITKQGAKIALYMAGTTPYFLRDRTYIDLLGKNDKYIAHLNSQIGQGIGKFTSFNPGHTKYDYEYSISSSSPDIVIIGNIPNSLSDKYVPFKFGANNKCFLKKNSSYIKWDKL